VHNIERGVRMSSETIRLTVVIGGLTGDLITIVGHFAGKLYGMRSHKYKKLIEEIEA